MADKSYSLNFHLSDGTTKSVEFTAPQGPQGPAGGAAGEAVPEYVRAEAESVARTVDQHQSNDSIVFPFLTDAHCGYYLDKENAAATLAGQLLHLIGKRVPFDFIANGGDIATGAWDTTRTLTFDQVEDYTELTSEAHRGIPAVWVPGNHDDAPYQATADRVTKKEMFALFGRKNRASGAVCPNGCNYGFLDLNNRKLRVIFLDTDDKRSWGTVSVGSGETGPAYLNAHNLSGAQLQWLASEALDLTDKEDASQWGVVVISHVALNIDGTITDAVSGTAYAHSTANAAAILNAYQKGTGGSITHNGVAVSYDFSSAESRAVMICAVHGHNHMFTDEKVGSILSIGCPNVMNGRERVSADGNTYTKTAGTAEGTSFCILTIDRENSVIYADHVGAGYDREFPFSTEAAAYTNQIPISSDTDGSVFNGTGYQSGYRLGSSGTLGGQSGSYVTGFIPCKVGDIVRMKNVTFQYGVTSGVTSNNQRISFYTSDKAHIVQVNATGLGGTCNGVKGDDNIWTEFTVKTTIGGTDMSGVAYFRINGSYIGDDSIITVNEVITPLYLYNRGDTCDGVTGGWKASSLVYPTWGQDAMSAWAQDYNQGSIMTTKAVDLTEYNTLRFESSGNGFEMLVVDSGLDAVSMASSGYVDISALSGSYVVSMNCPGKDNGANISVTRVWLER